MSNFSFLDSHKDLSLLKMFCEDAENYAKTRPDLSAISARKAVEFLVKYIYTAQGGKNGNEKRLFDLLKSHEVQHFINDEMIIESINYIRILGNNALHNNKNITKSESMLCLENLYFFIAEVLTKLKIVDEYPTFDSDDIPLSAKEKAIEPENINADNPDTLKLFSDSIEKHPQISFDKAGYLSEAETRRLYIDARLNEAGWAICQTKNTQVRSKAGIEIKVDGMPNESGIGYCDYVLYGSNGLPLAVVEAKKTMVDPTVGRHEGELYCDCLEKIYHQRPVLYYTNGCQYWIDDGLYSDRQVSGFHSENELDLLIQRRHRDSLLDAKVNTSIVDRLYQIEAIKSVASCFENKHHRALLVMATGTGKTRVAIGAADLLMQKNWAKNILFLADRTVLVDQAEHAFKEFLPEVNTTILSEDSEPDMNARIMFSTYQTMIHYVDSDKKSFGIGRFDLIIVDEAHRSIYNKYRAIFYYFDALVLGLTATPKDEVDANTFKDFDCESGEPTFSYSYNEGISDGVIVPFNEPFTKITSIIERGINYNELSDNQKEEYENIGLGEEYDNNVPQSEINRSVINIPTIDIVLQRLMNEGIKIDDGNKLGKTIIFATNHHHGKMIVERFRHLYPEKNANFCQLVDYKTVYNNDLVVRFENDKDFQIAVSVDMLDTGIDIRDCVNLVFFKPVKSRIKFWQMIGRGTRTCNDLFGPGKDKDRFVIFDWCGNFEYFSVNSNGHENKIEAYSLSQKIFNKRLEILKILQSADNQDIEFNRKYYNDLKAKLIGSIKELKKHSNQILIRKVITTIDKYLNESVWNDITDEKEREIKSVLSPLIEDSNDDNSMVLKFDYKMLLIEYDLLSGKNFDDQKEDIKISQVRYTCNQLLQKSTIPSVHNYVSDLRNAADKDFWKSVSLKEVEDARTNFRNLVIFLDGAEKNIYYTNFDDEEINLDTNFDLDLIGTFTYEEKVMDYINKNDNSYVINKIKNMEQLTSMDIIELQDIFWNQLGSKDDFDKTFGSKENVAAIVRKEVELDDKAVDSEINKYLNDYNLNAKQVGFLRNIVDYINENGDITLGELLKNPSFRKRDVAGIFGENINALTDFVEHVHKVIDPNA